MQPAATKEALTLALSMTLFYWFALWMNWDMPKYGALAIALISVGTAGASTYGEVENTFHDATLRYLETSAGVIVYALVGVLLWPKRAGDARPSQAADVWSLPGASGCSSTRRPARTCRTWRRSSACSSS